MSSSGLAQLGPSSTHNNHCPTLRPGPTFRPPSTFMPSLPSIFPKLSGMTEIVCRNKFRVFLCRKSDNKGLKFQPGPLSQIVELSKCVTARNQVVEVGSKWGIRLFLAQTCKVLVTIIHVHIVAINTLRFSRFPNTDQHKSYMPALQDHESEFPNVEERSRSSQVANFRRVSTQPALPDNMTVWSFL